MLTEGEKEVVMSVLFISYAHEDGDLRKLIGNHLKVLELERKARLEVWSDKELEIGSDWKAMLEQKLEETSIAILILSSNFVNSEFIMNEELPWLTRRCESENLKVYPILARSFAYDLVPSLVRWQVKTFSGRSLAELLDHEKDAMLSAMVHEIEEAITPQAVVWPPLSREPGPIPLVPLDPPLTMEISLRHCCSNEYEIDTRFKSTHEKEIHSLSHRAKIDMDTLKRHRENSIEYARLLERQIFPDGAPRAVRNLYNDGLKEESAKLRVNVEASARELQWIFWETLISSYASGIDSEGRSESFVRSTSGAGAGWPSPAVCRWPEPKVLIHHLEREGIWGTKDLLQDYASAFKDEPIAFEISDGRNGFQGLDGTEPHLLLLLVHIDSMGPEPTVIARSAKGTPKIYTSEELSCSIRRLSQRPQVIMLDTLNDSGPIEGDFSLEESLIRMASELITSGVCAVVTRQAPFERRRWLKFLATLASELGQTGNLDLAASSARLTLEAQEAWKPVVLTRLRTGQIWYKPMFLTDSTDAWELLVPRIRSGKCIPIIGPLVSEHVTRSRIDIAASLAEMNHYPGRRSERSDLRKVAQYVATTKEPQQVWDQYSEAVRQHLLGRYGHLISNSDPDQDILVLLKGIWDSALSRKEDDPYMLLAKLKLPLYLTTNLHNYLSLAMQELGKKDSPTAGEQPNERVRERIFTEEDKIYGEEEDLDENKFMLSKNQPLLYHLFGRLDQPRTMVLTEDDHFRFLLRFNQKEGHFPQKLRGHISESALLFLGFDLGEWEFRSIFRALLEIEGAKTFRNNLQVAVQVSADDDTLSDPAQTQKYMVKYFNQISDQPLVFLGSAQEFLLELQTQLKRGR